MLDNRYNFLESEKKWQEYWQKEDIYKFDENSNKKVYSIDTPPPTVNGKIHMGHLSSYIHIETIARYQRMMGKMFTFHLDLMTMDFQQKDMLKNKLERKPMNFQEKNLLLNALKLQKNLKKSFLTYI